MNIYIYVCIYSYTYIYIYIYIWIFVFREEEEEYNARRDAAQNGDSSDPDSQDSHFEDKVFIFGELHINIPNVSRASMYTHI